MNYRQEVLRNLNVESMNDPRALLSNVGLGIAGEAGEVADLIKKKLYHGKPVSKQDFIKEIGDLRWYMEAMMYAIGTTMEEVEATNVAKLRLRYPNGFSTKDANERKDEV